MSASKNKVAQQLSQCFLASINHESLSRLMHIDCVGLRPRLIVLSCLLFVALAVIHHVATTQTTIIPAGSRTSCVDGCSRDGCSSHNEMDPLLCRSIW
jgi:hypothetical protein